jgi:hypothetical protein
MSVNPTIIVNRPSDRALAARWVATAAYGTTISFAAAGRSLPQNARLHAMCTDVANQIPWAGKKRSVEAWKDIFTAALLSADHELDVVPGINGGFVLLGLHTSSLKKAQMGELMDLIEAWGAQNGVEFSEPEPADLSRVA